VKDVSFAIVCAARRFFFQLSVSSCDNSDGESSRIFMHGETLNVLNIGIEKIRDRFLGVEANDRAMIAQLISKMKDR